MEDAPNLFAQQLANRRRSRWLVAAFLIFFAWLGLGADLLMYGMTADAPAGHYHHVFPWFGILLVAIGIVLARWGWMSGSNAVLWSTGAREITTPRTPDEQQHGVRSGHPSPAGQHEMGHIKNYDVRLMTLL